MVFCRECGAQQADGAAFCAQCGAQFSTAAAQPAPTQSARMSVGAYLGTLLLMSIPVVGLILAIVWACSAENPDKKNLARAWLIILLIGAVLGVLAAVVVGGIVSGLLFGLATVMEPEIFDEFSEFNEFGAYGDLDDLEEYIEREIREGLNPAF